MQNKSDHQNQSIHKEVKANNEDLITATNSVVAEINSSEETAEETITRELKTFKEDVAKKIKTPLGIKIISALISGLIIGFGIWIFMSIITQSGNPTTASWILGIVLLQMLDALSDFTPRLQTLLSKILSEKL